MKIRVLCFAAGLACAPYAALAADEDAGAPAAETAASAATASPAAGLPDLDADQYFEGETPGTFGVKIAKVLPNSRRVAVLGFRMVFITRSEASAQVRASYLPGQDKSGAHAKMAVQLQGVGNATLQALTDKAYASFLAQLAAAGREVVPAERIAPLYAQLKTTPSTAAAPYEASVGGRQGYAFAPSGMPLWWGTAEAWGDAGFSQANSKAFASYSKEVDAIAIAPVFVVDFTSMQSSGNRSGLLAREASVGTELGISVSDMASPLARAEEVRYGGIVTKGDSGTIRMVKRVRSDREFATLEVLEQKKTSGLLAVMTGSSKSSSLNAAVTDDARYAAAAEPAILEATGALAKFFAQHAS